MKVKAFIRHDCPEDCDVRYYEDGWHLVSRSYCVQTDEFVERKTKISFCPLCGKLLPLLTYEPTEVEQKTAGTTVEDFKKALKNWADSSAIFTGNGSWTTTQ